MKLAVLLHNELAATPVGKANANACILHGAGKTHRLPCCHGGIIGGLDGLQRLHEAGSTVHDLTVGQHAAGTDGVAHTNLPRRDADLLRHHVQHRFSGKAGLGHAEATESAGGRIVGIVGVALDLKILVGIRAGCVGAGALQHGAAQGGKGARIGLYKGLHALNHAVFIAAHGQVDLHVVTLGMDEDGLGARELHLHRTAGHIGQQRCMMLHRHILLTAETAAHQHILHVAVIVVHAQHRGTLVEGGVCALIGSQQLHATIVHRQRYAALGL